MSLLTNKRVTHTLGRPFLHRMDELVFELGSTRLTRQQLAQIANPFPSIRCARFLQATCKRRGITSLNGLFSYGPVALATVEGAGETTLWVAMCLLDHAGFSVTDWFEWNRKDVDLVTWRTYQVRAEREDRRKKKAGGKRKNGS